MLGEFCTGHAAAGVVWGEFCAGCGADGGVLGEFCTGHAAAGVVPGEFCTGHAAAGVAPGEFCTDGDLGAWCWGPCELAAAPNEAATRLTSHADPSAAVVRGVSGRCSVISHAIPFKFHAFLFQSVTTCHLCCGIACDLREGLGLREACGVLGVAYGC